MHEQQEQQTGQFPVVFRFRTDTETARYIREDAQIAGMSVGRYLRHKISGQHVSSKYDLQLLNELRRQGGLLKHLAYNGIDTNEALEAVIRTMRKIQDTI